jgi:hypothetical protein
MTFRTYSSSGTASSRIRGAFSVTWAGTSRRIIEISSSISAAP